MAIVNYEVDNSGSDAASSTLVLGEKAVLSIDAQSYLAARLGDSTSTTIIDYLNSASSVDVDRLTTVSSVLAQHIQEISEATNAGTSAVISGD